MRIAKLLILSLVAPFVAVAQAPTQLPAREQHAIDRLQQVLPAEVAEQVIGTVNDAIARGLPGLAIAERALEGIAKGRSGDEVRTAAQEFANQLAAGRDALRRGGDTPDASEIDAAATTMSLGVDGRQVSELAVSAPSGRSLAVPLAVLGALVECGLPSDGALAAVKTRLEQRASDLALIAMPSEAERLIAQGYKPTEVGLALAALRSGIVAGPPMSAPSGVPAGVPVNSGQQGRRPQVPVTPPRP